MNFRGRTFQNEDVTLDGNSFENCTFRNCRVIFRGSAATNLVGNQFGEGVNWVFDGPAALTIAFLSALYRGGAKELVEQTLENIRRGRVQPTAH